MAEDSFECQFFASEEDVHAWLNHSGECQSLIRAGFVPI